MNKIIPLLFFVILVSSCQKKVTTKEEYHFELLNQSEKKLFLKITTNHGVDSILCNAKDSVSLNFIRVYERTETIFPMEPFDRGIDAEREELYNITDTTKYISTPFRDTKQDTVFQRQINRLWKNDCFLVDKLHYLQDSAKYMQKDYTMLEKFRDYYNK